MKKIVALVLALVLALSLATVAFGVEKGTNLSSTDTNTYTVVATIPAADYVTYKTVEYLQVNVTTAGGTTTTGKYIQVSNINDAVFSYGGAYYAATTEVGYKLTGTSYSNPSVPTCDKNVYTAGKTYITVDGSEFEATVGGAADGTGAVLVDGKYLMLKGTAATVAPNGNKSHVLVSLSKDSATGTITCKCLLCGKTVYANANQTYVSNLLGKQNYSAQYNGANATQLVATYVADESPIAFTKGENDNFTSGTTTMNNYYVWTDGTAATAAGTTTTTGVSSAKTFDAGVALYAGMALMSVAGSAVVIGKKKEF